MRVLELFSGTGTLSRIARARGHKAFTVDLYEPADLQADVLTLTPEAIYEATGWDHIDMLWASPICTGFSIAAVGKSWHHPAPGVYIPKSKTAELSLALLERTFWLISELKPTTWFVENPRGMARKMQVVQGHRRVTVTFCQYGDKRMKPTDIWTNTSWQGRPMCKRGDSCHEAAPRGSKTGTQGIKGALNRAKLPEELCHEVIEAAEAEVQRLGEREEYQPLLFPDEVWRVWAEQMGAFGVLAPMLRARSVPAAPPPGWRSAHDDQPSQDRGLDRT